MTDDTRARPTDRAGGADAPEPAAQSQPDGAHPSHTPIFRVPTDEELREVYSSKWEISGPFNIDQWPAEVLALSIPTIFIAANPERLQRIYDGDLSVMNEYAAKIDEVIGWNQRFIRLNSRSPKDAAPEGLPITCAGKQAMSWIAASMRCADDISLHRFASKPLFICTREWMPIRVEFEFRCFAKNGEMIAVSRYDYLNPPKVGDEVGKQVFEAARSFYNIHLRHHYEEVVFDLYAPGTRDQLLIELNPYGLSDPCLFGSYEAVERGGWMIRDSDTRRMAETGTGSVRSTGSAGRNGIARKDPA